MTRTRVAVLLAALLAPGAAAAQPAAEPGKPPAAAAVQPAMPDIGRNAEEVAARLRQMTESLSDTEAFAALEAEVAAETHRIAQRWDETRRLLEGKPRRLALDSLAGSWSATRAELEDANARIGARARRREADAEALTKMRESWTQALDLAAKAEAPAYVLERARATLAAIDATRPGVEERRAKVLVLQDTVSRSLQACDDALARIGDARREAVERIFSDRDPAVWRLRDRTFDARAGWLSLQAEAAVGLDSLLTYERTYRFQFVVTGLLALVMIVLFRRARERTERWAAQDAFFASAAAVFRTPYAAAILLTIVLTRPLRPHPPAALWQLNLMIGMLMAVFVLRPFLAAPRIFYGLAILFAIQLASDPLSKLPALDQVVCILDMAATAALLLWAATQLPQERILAARLPRIRSVGPLVLRVFALGSLASVAAAAIGYVALALFMGGGALFLIYTALVLLAFRVAADGLVAIALVEGPLARLRAVARHRALVERRIGGALDLLAVLLWISIGLSRFELFEPARALLYAALDARLHVGDLDFAVGRLLGFFAVVAGAYLTTRLVVFALEEDVYSRMALPRGVPYALSTLTRYALLLAGFLLALGTLGLDLTRVTVLVSAFGIGIGFGLQQIISNFVSGLILLFERPVQVGDSVQLGDLSGEVTRIGIRSSTVWTPEGAEVIVPNSKMIEDRVTNWTLSDQKRRVDLEIGVAYDTDADRILALLVEVARRDPRVEAQPEPEALLVKFGESSADFQLRVWTAGPHWTRLRSDLGVAIQRALREARQLQLGAAPQRQPGQG
jgi:small-conductance mechanosensitive channel